MKYIYAVFACKWAPIMNRFSFSKSFISDSAEQIRLEPFFYVFDRLRHRHVTRHQFFRVLDTATGHVLHLSAEEETALFNQYSRDDGLVNYRAFSDRICDVRRDVEKTHAPDGLLDDSAATYQDMAAGARGHQLPPAEEHHFRTVLLPRLQHLAREQGILVKAHFVDFDSRSTGRTSKISGRVTKAQFLRGLPDKFKERCTDREIDLLANPPTPHPPTPQRSARIAPMATHPIPPTPRLRPPHPTAMRSAPPDRRKGCTIRAAQSGPHNQGRAIRAAQ